MMTGSVSANPGGGDDRVAVEEEHDPLRRLEQFRNQLMPITRRIGRMKPRDGPDLRPQRLTAPLRPRLQRPDPAHHDPRPGQLPAKPPNGTKQPDRLHEHPRRVFREQADDDIREEEGRGALGEGYRIASVSD
ncbi:MAG: hypothetical protein JWO97_895 [Acidobacteria bacterium]|nr:hypothetical protein [Acidobacteriota bacterium]